MSVIRKVPAHDPAITRLLAEYREAAEGTSRAEPKQANASHDKMHACYRRLRETDEGRNGISSLMEDGSKHVQCWAAAHSLAWAPGPARERLVALRDSGGPCSFDAEMTLNTFEEGTLTFEY
jgi:hypothetical protein